MTAYFLYVPYRKKYRPTSSGKVNLSKVTSRTNSGLKQRSVQSTPPDKDRREQRVAQHDIPSLQSQPSAVLGRTKLQL